MTVLLGLLLLCAIGFWLWRASTKRASPALRAGIGILATPEMIEADKVDHVDVMRLFEVAARASGALRSGAAEQVLAEYERHYTPLGRPNPGAACIGTTILTVAEKKALGLNTRMKYTQEFLAWFEPSALPTIEPKSLVSGWFQNAFHRVQRHRQLANYKAAGIKRVKVFSCGDCIDVQRLRGATSSTRRRSYRCRTAKARSASAPGTPSRRACAAPRARTSGRALGTARRANRKHKASIEPTRKQRTPQPRQPGVAECTSARLNSLKA